MLSCFAAILTGEEGDLLYISKRNGAAVSGCSVERFLQGQGSGVDHIAVCGFQTVIGGVQIQPERRGNHRIVKGMNGAFQIFNGFLFRRKRFFARVLIIGCLACACDIAAAVYGERQGDGCVCIHLDLCIG